jgi:hypothetical protein
MIHEALDLGSALMLNHHADAIGDRTVLPIDRLTAEHIADEVVTLPTPTQCRRLLDLGQHRMGLAGSRGIVGHGR